MNRERCGVEVYGIRALSLKTRIHMKRNLLKRRTYASKETCKRDINIKWIERYKVYAQRLIPTKTRIHMKIDLLGRTCKHGKRG